MLINALSIALLYTLMKLVTKTLNSNMTVFLYKFTVFIFIIPWVFRKGFDVLKTPNFKLHMLRGMLSIGGSLLFMYGLKHVELANATAISYLEQIIWVLIGTLYFKEKIIKIKIFAIIK